jgi:hypothetical protein
MGKAAGAAMGRTLPAQSSVARAAAVSAADLSPAPLLEPAPCDGCARARRCAAELLACSAFAAFTQGRVAPYWHVLPRVDATRERYERLYG